MAKQLEAQGHRSPAVVKKAAAGILLVVLAGLAIKAIIGTLISIIVVVAVAVAVLWALKTIVW
jgi:hypothetical protein